jgi:hypothetical protein
MARASGIMKDVQPSAELAAVLRRIAELLSRDDCDVGWSTYERPEEIRAEIEPLLEKADAGVALGDGERARLRLLFAPTGPLQEASISSGWGTEFLSLATRFDQPPGARPAGGGHEDGVPIPAGRAGGDGPAA